jgi:threonine dehydrogenase-like Zn-dependent dehydrogenase
MRAAVRRNNELIVSDIADPKAGPGQVLVRTHSCGICGTDLHALKHPSEAAELYNLISGSDAADINKDIVFGHEFSAEIVEFGPDTERTLKVGAPVCSMPVAFTSGGAQTIGFSNGYPGGFGELMVLQENFLLEVPNGLPTDIAALTEPMAVGYHAVQRAEMGAEDAALVLGCGPVGLAVISALKVLGLGPIIAADFAPGRRAFAEQLGADIIVDPAQVSPASKWEELGVKATRGDQMAALAAGEPNRRPIIFECVGVPGMIQNIVDQAPAGARIVVAGVCMETDHFEPMPAITKELDFRFALGYSGAEFATTLRNLAEGQSDASAIITDRIGLEGVADAFKTLGAPSHHAKILVQPHG